MKQQKYYTPGDPKGVGEFVCCVVYVWICCRVRPVCSFGQKHSQQWNCGERGFPTTELVLLYGGRRYLSGGTLLLCGCYQFYLAATHATWRLSISFWRLCQIVGPFPRDCQQSVLFGRAGGRTLQLADTSSSHSYLADPSSCRLISRGVMFRGSIWSLSSFLLPWLVPSGLFRE